MITRVKLVGIFGLMSIILIGCLDSKTSTDPSSNNLPNDGVRTQFDKERDYFPTEEWVTRSPSELGLNEEVLDELKEEVSHEGVNNMLLIKDGYIVEDYYKSVVFEEKRVPINSIAKNITSILIGIAIEQGYIEGVNQKASEFISEILNEEDPRKSEWTIEHFLTMTDGLDWPETTRWTEVMTPLESSDNWLEFIIARELAADPGEAFNYNTGASHLLSVIIERATGTSTKQFADEYLFSPLGIGPNDYFWDVDSSGYYTGGYKMEMEPTDLAKIGYLFLNGGQWEGDQIVRHHWVEASTTYQTSTELEAAGLGDYGYQWWVKSLELNNREKIHSYYGSGAFGQKLIVIPHYDFVAVFTSSIYNHPYSIYFEQITEQFLLDLFEE